MIKDDMGFAKLFYLSFIGFIKEHESRLAYLYGNQIDKLSHLKKIKKRHKGFIYGSYAFIKKILSKRTLNNHDIKKQKDILFFYGSFNQLNSLKSTINEFDENSYTLITDYVENNNISYTNKIIVVALLLFAVRVLPLYIFLRKGKNKTSIALYFHKFCESYIYVPYFIELLNYSKPKLVVMANDHNVINRCLKLASEILKVKVIYMQHASVSSLFPQLDFDYAFLDGMYALETYKECTQKTSNKTIVFLNGQKKIVKNKSNNKKNTEKIIIGIGINALDDIKYVIGFTEKISKNAVIIVRTHPSQNNRDVIDLNELASKNENIYISDSKKEPLDLYFEKINCLIAANTSLHLEASLNGIPSLYYEFGQARQADYYGFIKKGISLPLQSNPDIDDIQVLMRKYFEDNRQLNLKYYSETFDTQWRGKEGKLSAETIKSIINNHSFDSIYSVEYDDFFGEIYRL